jgi:hypothetical protein
MNLRNGFELNFLSGICGCNALSKCRWYIPRFYVGVVLCVSSQFQSHSFKTSSSLINDTSTRRCGSHIHMCSAARVCGTFNTAIIVSRYTARVSHFKNVSWPMCSLARVLVPFMGLGKWSLKSSFHRPLVVPRLLPS